jgi:lysyl-tRNA synthetase class 1
MNMPGWLQATLTSFETSEKPFMEVAISGAINSAVAKQGEIADEDRPVIHAEWSAFQFMTRSDTEGVWGTHFAPMMIATTTEGKQIRSPDIADLNVETVKHWQERARAVQDPVMRARYADLVWDLEQAITGQRASHHSARIAIDAYIEATDRRRFTMDIEAVTWLRRALDLSLSLRDAERVTRAVQSILEFYDAVAVPQSIGVWVFPFDALYDRKDITTPEQQAKIIADLESMLMATSTMDGSGHFDPHGAEAAAERLAEHYRRGGDNANVHRVIKCYGEAFMKLSKDASPMLAVAWLQPVIERYEQEGLRQEAEQLQLLASRKAKDVESDMKTVSVPYEIKKEEIDSFLNSITADSLDASLHRLAAYFIPKVANARDLLERMRRDTPLLSLISITRFDADGCPVGRIGSIDDDPDGRLHQQLWQSMSIQGPFLVWAIDRLREKYAPTVDDLLTFLRQSPLFGVSKDAILREGIDAYWASDFIKAIHVLVPQVERILRDLLALLGIPPVKTVRRHPGILDAKNMNDALEDERVRAALTEDLWRYLYILYVDRRGGLNLRNDLAHGLAKEETFNRIIADRVIHSLLALSFLRTTEKEGEPNS